MRVCSNNSSELEGVKDGESDYRILDASFSDRISSCYSRDSWEVTGFNNGVESGRNCMYICIE